MIFEITQDYQILVPLMVANLLSFVISRRYQPIPVYEALLRQDQIHLPSGVREEPTGWTAGDLMNAQPIFLPSTWSVDTAWEAARQRGQPAHLVGAPEEVLGVITTEQLASAHEAGRREDTIGSAVARAFPHVHPDHPLDVVLERFAESAGVLPVVSRAAARRVEGVIGIDR